MTKAANVGSANSAHHLRIALPDIVIISCPLSPPWVHPGNTPRVIQRQFDRDRNVGFEPVREYPTSQINKKSNVVMIFMQRQFIYQM